MNRNIKGAIAHAILNIATTGSSVPKNSCKGAVSACIDFAGVGVASDSACGRVSPLDWYAVAAPTISVAPSSGRLQPSCRDTCCAYCSSSADIVCRKLATSARNACISAFDFSSPSDIIQARNSRPQILELDLAGRDAAYSVCMRLRNPVSLERSRCWNCGVYCESVGWPKLRAAVNRLVSARTPPVLAGAAPSRAVLSEERCVALADCDVARKALPTGCGETRV